MTERPVLFNGPMVRAILEGRKIQTRRVVKPQPPNDFKTWQYDINGPDESFAIAWQLDGLCKYSICPYGKVGDSLWVRETFAINIPGCPDGLTYRADHHDPTGDGPVNPIRWHPSIHMPRRASRITLEITGVRVERLQDISTDDIKAEGVYPGMQANNEAWPAAVIQDDGYQYIHDFMWLWDSINAKRGYTWQSNPWVWVIEFKRIESEAI